MPLTAEADTNFATEWGPPPDSSLELLNHCRLPPARSPRGAPFEISSLVCPTLTDGNLTQEQERNVALEAAAEVVSQNGAVLDRAHARVLDLREISLDPGNPDRVDKSWLYIVIAPKQCVVLSSQPSAIVKSIETPFHGGALELVDKCPVAAALRIIGRIHERTSDVLDMLGRQVGKLQESGTLTTEQQIATIPGLSRSISYVAARLIDEEAAVDELARYVTDVDLEILGVKDRPRLTSAIAAQKRSIDTRCKRAELSLSSLREVLDIAQWKVEDETRKAQAAEVDAQRVSNGYSFMLTMLGGVTIPVGLSLAYIQSFQMTGEPAQWIFRLGVLGAALLTGFCKPMHNWLRGNNRTGTTPTSQDVRQDQRQVVHAQR